MTIQEIEQCYGINCVDEVFNMVKNWSNSERELMNYFNAIQCPWDAECLEMLIRYNFINVTR